jgi:hypothetical protein
MENAPLQQKHLHPVIVHLFAPFHYLPTRSLSVYQSELSYGETLPNTPVNNRFNQPNNAEPLGEKGRASALVRA